MPDPTTTQIALPLQDLSTFFASPSLESANKLASLINNHLSSSDLTKQNTTSLDSLLTSITQQTILSSFAHREKIDDYITFLSYTALHINSAATHPGCLTSDGKPAYKTATLRPSNGPGILGENLSKGLYDSLWGATSRAYTPFEDDDRDQPKHYYYQACVHATILARAFALGPETFREPLWRNIEDMLVKALFSGGEQEPGIFVGLAAVLLGAGKDIKEFMGDEKLGHGKSWLWYDDIRTEEGERWGWEDIVRALKSQPGDEMAGRLPEYVRNSFDAAKEHIGNGSAVPEDWDSERLAVEVFKWVSLD